MNLTSLSTLVTQWPTDWIIIGAFAAVVALDTLRAGSSRAAAFSLASLLSVTAFGELSQTTPTASFIGQFSAPIAQMVLFGIVLAILFLFMSRVVGLWGNSSEGPIQALIAGVACAGIVASVWLQVPTLDTIWHFGPQVQLIFGASYRLWWLIGGAAALAYVRS